MRYFFSEDRFGTMVTFNDIQKQDGKEIIPFYIEQVRLGDANEPFNFAEGSLPSGKFTRAFGFSPTELDVLQAYILRNAELLYEIARERACAA